MVYFPQEILIEIVKRVGRHGFRELGPFIASGKDGKNAVFSSKVLVEADLDEFIFVSSLSNEGTPFRYFFMKCFDAGNETALYVEGLRRLVKYGPSIESLELIHRAEGPIFYAAFAYGIFAICAGCYEEGRTAMHILAFHISWLDEMVEIGEAVMAQIADLEPPLSGNYDGTYRYPEGDIPNCVHFACTMNDVCFDCLPYWYSHRVRQLC